MQSIRTIEVLDNHWTTLRLTIDCNSFLGSYSCRARVWQEIFFIQESKERELGNYSMVQHGDYEDITFKRLHLYAATLQICVKSKARTRMCRGFSWTGLACSPRFQYDRCCRNQSRHTVCQCHLYRSRLERDSCESQLKYIIDKINPVIYFELVRSTYTIILRYSWCMCEST